VCPLSNDDELGCFVCFFYVSWFCLLLFMEECWFYEFVVLGVGVLDEHSSYLHKNGCNAIAS
jgi:hypothetical protein